MANVLITGGAGFIGTNLALHLQAAGHTVSILDCLITGRAEKVHGFLLIRQDVRQPITGTYDWIFHLACPASPPHYQADPLFTLTTAFEGTRQVLQCAHTCGARVILASTSEVYGDPQVHPQPEYYWGHVNPIGMRSCYDEGKRAAETLAFIYRTQYQVDVRVARIFNTYGPYMEPDDGRVISNFILQALHHKPITLYGDGAQTRSCQYIKDLLEAFELYIQLDPILLESFFSIRNMALPVLNLGNPQEYTIKMLAEIVLNAIPESNSSLCFRPLPQDDPKRRRPDISLAHACLGWTPKVLLTEGIARTVDYFRSVS